MQKRGKSGRFLKIIVIDGQGGKIGSILIKQLMQEMPEAEILAIGTNSAATGNMLKAGAYAGCSGENPVVVQCKDADIIAGPIGISIANSLLGEVTPKMANAVWKSRAEKILIPCHRCRLHIPGVEDKKISELIGEAVSIIKDIVSGKKTSVFSCME